MQALLDRGVSSRRGIMNAHREAPYRREGKPWVLPNSEHAQDRRIILPLFPQMTEAEQQTVCQALKEACQAT
jgi:perosamine synthetase